MPRPRPSSPRCSSRWKPELRHSPRRYPAAAATAAVQAARSVRRSAAPAARSVRTSTTRIPSPRSARPHRRARSTVTAGSPAAAARLPSPAPCGVPNTRCERPVVLGLLQQREDAAAVVVRHHQDQVGARLAGAEEQAGRVVQEREVAQQRRGGAAPRALVGQGGTGRGGDHPVDPARAPAGQHPEPGARRHLLIEVADRQAGRGPQQRAVRQRRRQVTREPRLGQAGPRGRGSRSRRPGPPGPPRATRPATWFRPRQAARFTGASRSRIAGATSVALRAGSAQWPGPWATTTCRTGAACFRKPSWPGTGLAGRPTR